MSSGRKYLNMNPMNYTALTSALDVYEKIKDSWRFVLCGKVMSPQLLLYKIT
jgi:hypothetical protein